MASPVRLLLAPFVVAGSLGLAACGDSSTDGAASSGKGDDKTTTTVSIPAADRSLYDQCVQKHVQMQEAMAKDPSISQQALNAILAPDLDKRCDELFNKIPDLSSQAEQQIRSQLSEPAQQLLDQAGKQTDEAKKKLDEIQKMLP